MKNNNLYNDKELFDDADLDWYDYGFRNYDPQIGRFPQLDPLTSSYPELTPYQYASDEPVANVDMDGLEAIGSTVSSAVGDAVVTQQSFLEGVVVKGLSHSLKSSGNFLSAAGHFFKGFGKDIWGAVKGVAHAAIHLDKTVSSLVRLNTTVGQINMALAAYKKSKEVQQQWKNGSLNDRAELTGAAAGELLQLFGGEVAEVGKVGEVSKVLEASEDMSRSVDAGLAAEGAADVGISELPNQIHHFATNKNSIFTKQMSAIAKKYGLDLDEAWNKASMPHLGRHPNLYHNFVLEGMQRASLEAGENQTRFLQLFDKYVKQPVLQNPNLLRKSGW